MSGGRSSRWLTDRFTGILDGLLGSLAILTIAFVASRGVTPVLILTFAIPVLMLSIIVTRRHVRRHRQETSRRVDLTMIAGGVDFGRLALSYYLTAGAMTPDSIHRFALLDARFSINGGDGLFEYHYEGMNASRQPSR